MSSHFDANKIIRRKNSLKNNRITIKSAVSAESARYHVSDDNEEIPTEREHTYIQYNTYLLFIHNAIMSIYV